MTHKCPICDGRDINVEGIKLANEEVIRFFKIELLELRYSQHPFPRKYNNLFNSILCYAQALQFNRIHSLNDTVFYTSNKWLLKYSKNLGEKFGMPTDDEKNIPNNPMIACEYNTKV